MEVWKEIKGLKNYQVSNYGNVEGLEIKTNFGCSFKTYPHRVINPWIDKKGYYYIDISNNGDRTRFLLHRLVAIHFIPNYKSHPQINHIDGCKDNNHVDNLEWCTAKHNINHAINSGLNDIKGINHPRSKLTKDDVLFIRRSNKTQQELSYIFSISQTGVSKIKRRQTYKNII